MVTPRSQLKGGLDVLMVALTVVLEFSNYMNGLNDLDMRCDHLDDPYNLECWHL